MNQTIQTLLCSDIGEGSNVPEDEMDETQQYTEETTSSSPSYINCGVQCCALIAHTKCNASPQTEGMGLECSLEQRVRIEELASEDLSNAKVDHPYSAKDLAPLPVNSHSGVFLAPNSPFPDGRLDSSRL